MHSLLVHIYHIEGTLMALMATLWHRLLKITNLKNLKKHFILKLIPLLFFNNECIFKLDTHCVNGHIQTASILKISFRYK